jgi:hypothetical protein
MTQTSQFTDSDNGGVGSAGGAVAAHKDGSSGNGSGMAVDQEYKEK